MAETKPDPRQAQQELLRQKQAEAERRRLEKVEQERRSMDRIIDGAWGGGSEAAGAGDEKSRVPVREVPGVMDRGVLHLPAGATVMDAIRFLAAHKIGLVLVCDAGGQLAGVLSERDVIRALAAHGPKTLGAAVDSFVTADVITCRSTDVVGAVAAIMGEKKIRHLPVVDGGVLKGMISATDVVAHFASKR